MDVKLLHSLSETNVEEQSGDYSYLPEDESTDNEQPIFPFLLYLITILYLGAGIIATLASWGGTAFYPGVVIFNRAMLEINVLALPTILPLGVYAPLIAVTGYGIMKRKQWGLSLLAFAFGLALSSALFFVIKFPTFFSIAAALREFALLQYNFQYGRFFVYFLLYLYLMTEGVQSYFGVNRKETLRNLVLGFIIAFTLTGIITCFSSSIFGWESVRLGYVNSRWFR